MVGSAAAASATRAAITRVEPAQAFRLANNWRRSTAAQSAVPGDPLEGPGLQRAWASDGAPNTPIGRYGLTQILSRATVAPEPPSGSSDATEGGPRCPCYSPRLPTTKRCSAY